MTIATVNPTNGKTLKIYDETSMEEINKRIETAHEAYRSWRKASFSERAAVLKRVSGVLLNSGQSCIAAKRFVVVETIRKRFETLFVGKMRVKKMGDPMDENVEIGPLARFDLRENLHRQVTESVEQGAECLLGGRKLLCERFRQVRSPASLRRRQGERIRPGAVTVRHQRICQHQNGGCRITTARRLSS